MGERLSHNQKIAHRMVTKNVLPSVLRCRASRKGAALLFFAKKQQCHTLHLYFTYKCPDILQICSQFWLTDGKYKQFIYSLNS